MKLVNINKLNYNLDNKCDHIIKYHMVILAMVDG